MEMHTLLIIIIFYGNAYSIFTLVQHKMSERNNAIFQTQNTNISFGTAVILKKIK